ncbi:hypothetical protein E2C01_082438 [Portunus trituberculatus]|uniref:Uncharacterized protein n=1 Tax=Portunus trituberculatus TaxID=210409 RepID=A0A5B7IUK1_PORTR|nr:hypothetical protein [Portunus trituberculatus]
MQSHLAPPCASLRPSPSLLVPPRPSTPASPIPALPSPYSGYSSPRSPPRLPPHTSQPFSDPPRNAPHRPEPPASSRRGRYQPLSSP